MRLAERREARGDLYCLIRVAEHYDIGLEQAHITARRKEMRYLGKDPEF